MYVVFVAVAAVVVFAVAAAAVGRGDGLEEPFPDMERPYLPDGRVEAADIDDVHFAVSFRGYRMDQVDSVLDRLAGQLVERDRHIARLERMVQTQARQSVMAYAPPRTRVGMGSGQPSPDVPGEAPEARPGEPGASGPASPSAEAAADTAAAGAGETRGPAEGESPAGDTSTTGGPGDEAPRNGMSGR